jgi:hypothetical protein
LSNNFEFQSTFKFKTMKKHHFIFASSFVFTLLFYNQSVGLNLAVFGLFLTALIVYFFKNKFTSFSHWGLVFTSVLSCLSFSWYGDFASFLALFLSIAILQFKTQLAELKLIQVVPLIIVNGFTSLGRPFLFDQWIPKRELKNDFTKKLIAYFVIPLVFLLLFFVVYSFGSDHFSSLFTDYTLDLDIFELLLMVLVGFYISFTFWNFWVPTTSYEVNEKLANDFKIAEKVNQQTFSFLDLDFERKSGEITLWLLNTMLLVFIVTYNYEQFFEVTVSSSLSKATHERVNAVIFSTIMAVGILLFYFKGGFNFDKKAVALKRLSKIWIFLNAILIISTFVKNSEYVAFFGLTYKRLGVYAFLILALIGLGYTFIKIIRQKTNAYLFNQMVGYFYGTIVLCACVNWGNVITVYNISVGKGVEPIFLCSLNFNDEARANYFLANKISATDEEVYRLGYIHQQKNKSFLSMVLYYELLGEQK